MAAVDIGIRHDNNFMVTQLFQIEFIANAGAQRHNQRIELIIAVNLISAGFFDVQHLSPHGKNRLKTAVPALYGRTRGRIALHDINFTQGGIAFIAVLKLIRHLTGFQASLPAHGLTRLSRSFPCARGGERLIKDGTRHLGVFFKIVGKLLRHQVIHQCTHLAVSKLCLGLSLKLRFHQLYADDGRNAFADIFAGEIGIVVF